MTTNNFVDVKRLRYFIAVCKHGGFSHAASVIGVAQPALTRQVQLLERELGLKLITRTGRGATPTEEGRFLLDALNRVPRWVGQLALRAEAAFLADERPSRCRHLPDHIALLPG